MPEEGIDFEGRRVEAGGDISLSNSEEFFVGEGLITQSSELTRDRKSGQKVYDNNEWASFNVFLFQYGFSRNFSRNGSFTFTFRFRSIRS